MKLIVSEDKTDSIVYENLSVGDKVKVNGYEQSSDNENVIVDVTTIEIMN